MFGRGSYLCLDEGPPRTQAASPLHPLIASGALAAVVDKTITAPGTPLAYSEEFLPGHGTYDDGEHIRAAVFGTQSVDTQTMTIQVQPESKGVPSVEQGDIVVGRISYVKESLASVEILVVRGKEGRSLLQNVEGTLHVSKIDNRYIKDVVEEFHVGDVIRAKVIGLRGGPQLATDKPDLGVIKAFSRDDPTRALEKRGNDLVDPEDGHKERRKVASDYGSGQI